MLGRLPGDGDESGKIGGRVPVFGEICGGHSDHHREIRAGAVAGYEDLCRIAAVFGDVVERPRDGRRRVVDADASV